MSVAHIVLTPPHPSTILPFAASAAWDMPAVTLGLAEVTERLRVLRRRLNTFTVLQAVCASLTVVCLTGALLVVLGLRGTGATFRVVTWCGLLASLVTIAAAVAFVRRRWLSPAQTAQVADHRADLSDRLTTLFDLVARPRTSRLAPVLVAQTLALGDRWHLRRLAPRRVPRSIYLLVASLFVLGATPLIAPKAPDRPEPVGGSRVAAASSDDGASALASVGTRGAGNSNAPREDGTSQMRDMPPLQADGLGSGAEAMPGSAPPAEPKGDGALAALPDQLQAAIRRTFHAEPVDQPRELMARKEQESESAGRGDEGRTDGEGPPRRTQNEQQSKKDGRGAGQQQGQGNGTGEHGHTAQRPDAANPNPNFDGPAPAAGDGSSPGGLMAAAADGQGLGHDGPKTFKLMITSFLRSVEQRENTQRPTGPRSATNGDAAPVARVPAVLNDQQLRDDTLRKAEIPVEYEDIVRRVYSQRADQ